MSSESSASKASASVPAASANATGATMPPVSLKNPTVAGLLAWMAPGLGHLYQGRTAKGLLYFVAIFGTFAFGVFLGGNSELGWGRVVYWSRNPTRMAYVCQIGVGVAALPAIVQYRYQQRGLRPEDSPLGKFMWPPVAPHAGAFDMDELDQVNLELHRYFELGTVYTMIAGLLNLLVIFDAVAGPAPPYEDRSHQGGETPAKAETPRDQPLGDNSADQEKANEAKTTEAKPDGS